MQKYLCLLLICIGLLPMVHAIPDHTLSIRTGVVPAISHNKHGYYAGSAIGLKSGPLRYDLELNFSNRGFVASTGDVKLFTTFMNINYDVHSLAEVLLPYMGFGYGYLVAKLTNPPATQVSLNKFEHGLAVQSNLGINWKILPRLVFGCEYRYTRKMFIKDLASAFKNHQLITKLTFHF